MSARAPKTKSKPSQSRSMFRFIPSFVEKGEDYPVPTLEAISMAADVFPPLKSAAGGALWIARTLQEFKSSGKDEKAFANYLQQSVACVIASVVKNGDLPSLELHVQRLNEVLDEIREDIVKRQSQPPSHRFRRFIKNRQQLQEDKARLDRALVVFNLGATVAAHEELFNILKDTGSIISTLQSLQNLRADIGTVKEDVAQTRVIATNVQRDIVHMDDHLEKVSSGVDALHTDLGWIPGTAAK